MGIFDSLFGKKNDAMNISDETKRYNELIRFIKFCKQIKSLTGNNYGLNVTYHAPEKGYTGTAYATFKFCDFNEIRFAREYAFNGNFARMVQHYYKTISEAAGLERSDWPYNIDADDFLDVLNGSFCQEYFTLIPDEYNDDIFTFKVVGGFDGRNALQVSNVIQTIVKSSFPELKVTNNHATQYSMGIIIQI